MFQDEARFGRMGYPSACWAPKGVRPVVSCQLVREFIYVYWAVSPTDGASTCLIMPDVNAQTMSLFLKTVAQDYPNDFILMVLDGAGWHRAKDLCVPETIRLIALPPYSPELNPAEHIWDELREKNFLNRCWSSIQELEDHLEKACHSLLQKTSTLASLCSFPWIINAVSIVN